jgi:PilZ domain-containing protein
MNLLEFFESPPPWQTLVIPAVGLVVTLLSLVVGRFILPRSRNQEAAPDTAKKNNPTHDPFANGSASERRGAARRKGNPVEILISDAEATKEAARACVVDRSMGGLCLLLNEPVEPGTVVSIKPVNGPQATPWVQVEVRSCKKDSSVYEVGCQFVRTPAWAVMLLFG